MVHPFWHCYVGNFNPRSRTGSDICKLLLIGEANHFNPRSRTGSDGGWVHLYQAGPDFNPRSRTGSDPRPTDFTDIDRISTHAPAQGATMPPSAPPPTTPKFQPTLPHRERRCSRAAPPDGGADFNPRSRTGSDAGIPVGDLQKNGFQPTLPHRERRGDSRPKILAVGISTHAPAQGATRPSRDGRAGNKKFQPTLPHRERPTTLVYTLAQMVISTHAPAQGATCQQKRFYQAYTISTHAPAQGATAAGEGCTPPRWDFNPRSRTGSDIAEVCGAGS